MGKDLFDLASRISDDDIVDESVKLLPHNQKLYDDIVTQLKIGGQSIFYSEGTGLGKSFIFMKLVHDYFKDARVLYIVPKNAIWNNVCHYKEFAYIADRVTLATFTTFNRYPNNNISCADYDVVFVDECHHMLSDVQGKNVKKFLDDMVSWDKHVFGMTATPEIEGVFVDEKCFDVSCYGLDMFEAIEQELMPKMDIAIGIKEDIDIPDNLREQYSVVGTKTLLETVIDDYKHVTHWLAYFTTREELEQNESGLRKLFPEFKILKAYYGLDNTEEVIAEFENSRQPVILMTVSMFLEGMHLDNVGGVLLYRNVQKGHTYAQILGRLCVIGQKNAPVMVDIPGSVLSIKQFYAPKSSRASNTQRKVYERKDIFDVTSRGYELLDLVVALDNIRSTPWTEEMITKLVESYKEGGLEKCIENFPDISKHSIYTMLRKNNVDLRPLAYKEWEDDLIRKEYPKYGPKIASRLNNRSKSSVSQRATTLGVTYNSHELREEEVALALKMKAEGKKRLEIAAALNELPFNKENGIIRRHWSVTSICRKTDSLNMGNWSEEDLAKLKRFIHEPNRVVIAQQIYPDKGRASLDCALRRISEASSIVPYTLAELRCIRDNSDLPIAELTEKVNALPCNRAAGIVRIEEGVLLQIKFIDGEFTYNRTWTEDEIEFLRESYPKYGMQYCKDNLIRRTVSSIYTVLSDLGIRREGNENKEFVGSVGCTPEVWTGEVYEGVVLDGYVSLAKFAGRSVDCVRGWMSNHQAGPKEYIDFIKSDAESYRGINLKRYGSELCALGFSRGAIAYYSRTHSITETIDYFLDYEEVKEYRGILLKSNRAVCQQLGISSSNWDKYTKRVNTPVIEDFIDYWYTNLITLGRFDTEDSVAEFIASNRRKLNI